MWRQDQNGRPCADYESEALGQLFKMFSGSSDDDLSDFEGMNASLNGIREILVNNFHKCEEPLFELVDNLKRGHEMGMRMLVDLLVWGPCGSDRGGTGKWLDAVIAPLQGDYHDYSSLTKPLLSDFARRIAGGEAPDYMAPCAYHIHPLGSSCDHAI